MQFLPKCQFPVTSDTLSNIYNWYFAQIQTLLFFMSLHKYREMAHYRNIWQVVSAKQMSVKLNIVIKINRIVATLCNRCHILETFEDFVILRQPTERDHVVTMVHKNTIHNFKVNIYSPNDFRLSRPIFYDWVSHFIYTPSSMNCTCVNPVVPGFVGCRLVNLPGHSSRPWILSIFSQVILALGHCNLYNI